jgi:hypothetical protein
MYVAKEADAKPVVWTVGDVKFDLTALKKKEK